MPQQLLQASTYFTTTTTTIRISSCDFIATATAILVSGHSNFSAASTLPSEQPLCYYYRNYKQPLCTLPPQQSLAAFTLLPQQLLAASTLPPLQLLLQASSYVQNILCLAHVCYMSAHHVHVLLMFAV